MIDGNIYFHAGKNKNISFHVTNGASIMLGKTDVLQLPNQTETNAIRTQLQTSWTRLELLSRTTIFAQKTIHELMKRTKELNTQVKAFFRSAQIKLIFIHERARKSLILQSV